MEHDRHWERLVDYVNEWASAREVPGGIAITFETAPGALRTIQVVMTSADWSDYISTMYGTGDPRETPSRQAVLTTPGATRFLVYDTYDWQPSETRQLSDSEVDPGPGEWVVADAEGNTIDRFADFDDSADIH